MISLVSRSMLLDAPPPPQAAVVGVHGPNGEAAGRRPQPVEAVERDTRVRRDQAGAAVRYVVIGSDTASEGDSSDRQFTPASLDATPAKRGPFGWLGLDSTPFMAQLAGQNATPRDPVAAGRSQTSFRHSPVDRYEEVQAWSRRAELMFVFDGMITAAAA